mgnify:CR=1 FL=1
MFFNRINKFIYDVLDAYNEHFLPVVSDDFLNAPEYVFTPKLFGDNIQGASLSRVEIISKSPLNAKTTDLGRIAVYRSILGSVNVYDTLIKPHKSIGVVNIDGTIIIDGASNIAFGDDLAAALDFIDGAKLSDLYYEFDVGGTNLFLIKKAALPAYLRTLSVDGGVVSP